MIDKNLIIRNLKYAKWGQDGDSVTALCPFHRDSKPSFGVNFKIRAYHCFSCGASGNLNKLAAHLGIAALKESPLEEKVPEPEPIISGDLVYKLIKERKESIVDPRELEERFLIDHPYLDFRDIPNWARIDLGIRYDKETRSLYAPLFDENGKIVSNFKRFSAKGAVKCVYPKSYKLINSVYGIFRRTTQHIAIITEGIIDCIRIQDYLYTLGISDKFIACSIYSSKILSDNQLKIFQKNGIEKIIVFFDNDLAGLEGIQKIKEKHGKKQTIQFYIPDYDLFPKGKDPDDLTLEETEMLIKSIHRL